MGEVCFELVKSSDIMVHLYEFLNDLDTIVCGIWQGPEEFELGDWKNEDELRGLFCLFWVVGNGGLDALKVDVVHHDQQLILDLLIAGHMMDLTAV